MAENIYIDENRSKKEKYELLLPQLSALIEGESDCIAKMANITAALNETFHFFWVGFYRVKGEDLVLAPFQGPVACSRIKYGKGVCGTAWREQRIIIVEDVDKFPGHIACNEASRSEIVLPIIQDNKVTAVLDIDSEHPAHFDDEDAFYLSKIIQLL